MSVLSASSADAVPVSLCELSMPQASSGAHLQDFLGHNQPHQQLQHPAATTAQQPPGNNNNVSSLGTILASSHELLAKSLLLSGIELGDVAHGLANGFDAGNAAKLRHRQSHMATLRYDSSGLGDDCPSAFDMAHSPSPNAMHFSAKLPNSRSPREDILNLSGQANEPKRSSSEGNSDHAKMPASQASCGVAAADAAAVAPSARRLSPPSPPQQHLLGDDALWPQDKGDCEQQEQLYFQGRLPWIVGGDPASGLAHPLSHPYPGPAHYPPPGHHPAYPLLPVMPPQPGQTPDAWGAIGIGLQQHQQQQHPGHPGQTLPPSTGSSTATNDVVTGAPYKLDPDAMQAAVASAAATASMYYPPHQAASGAGEVSSDASGTTATASDSLANFQSIQALEPQDMMQTLNQYFEEGAPWMDPGHQAAALAAAHHHPHIHQHSHQHQHNPVLDGYPPEYGLIRPSYHDRKKKLIKEWSKSSTNGSSSPSSAVTPTTSALAMAESMARSAISGGYAPDFLYNPTSYLKEEVGPLRGAAADYPYAYAAAYQEAATAAAGLVHPYTHHMAVAAGGSRVGDLGGLVGGGGGGRSRDRKRKNASAGASSVDSAGGSAIGGGHGMTRDERKALTLSLPIAVQEIINLPMDEFNDLLSKHDLTEEQLTLCRDIRRRGKNKVAARNCRKRKIDQIKQLEDDVVRIRHRKTELINEHEKLVGQRGHWSDILKRLHDYILKELGQDPNHFQLQMDHNRQVHVLPRSHADELDPSKLPRPYHYAPSIGPPIMEQTHTAR